VQNHALSPASGAAAVALRLVFAVFLTEHLFHFVFIVVNATAVENDLFLTHSGILCEGGL